MSDSSSEAKPSTADPSKPMPSSNASSSSSGEMAKDLRFPSTSENHSLTKRMSRFSTVRRTKSMSLSLLMCGNPPGRQTWASYSPEKSLT